MKPITNEAAPIKIGAVKKEVKLLNERAAATQAIVSKLETALELCLRPVEKEPSSGQCTGLDGALIYLANKLYTIHINIDRLNDYIVQLTERIEL